MSDSVKAWYEMQEDRENGRLIAPIKHPEKAYRILIDYDIKTIEKAVEIFYENLNKSQTSSLIRCVCGVEDLITGTYGSVLHTHK